MNNPINTTVKVLELYERWTGRQKKDAAQREKAREEALEALLAAVTETRAYLADRRAGRRRNRDREGKISQLWYKASVRVRHLDKRLSRILAMKSLGWADAQLWKTPMFRKVSLGLDLIQKQCLWLLDHDE